MINKRIYDLINIKEWEVKFSIVVSILAVIGLKYLDFYNCFFIYDDAIKNLLVGFVGAFIGLLGFSLSGIAIIVSLFSRTEERLIEDINGAGKIRHILSSYTFLACNIGIQCIIAIFLYLAITSGMDILSRNVFWIVTFLEIYHVIFIIFYTIALVKNCVELYKIKSLYGKIEEERKSIHDIANEVKVDYIMSTLMNIHGFTQDEVINNLIDFVEKSNIEDRDRIVVYIKSQYNRK